MKNVTYLIGAGASYGVLPVVKDFAAELSLFRHALANHLSKGLSTKSGKRLIEDLGWLIDATSTSLSIDTVAKKLHVHKDVDKLNRLKSMLSLFFINKQAAAKSPEQRYEGLFAAIIDDSWEELPSSIKIISWNYDSQIELSFDGFSKLNSIRDNQEKLGMSIKSINTDFSSENFSVFKLNGTAGFLSDGQLEDHYFKEIKSASDFNFIIEKYHEIDMNDSGRQALSFAWERDDVSDVIAMAERAAMETEILVVIGYSFPDFNRDIDARIINAMTGIEKVFIQDKAPEKIKSLLFDVMPPALKVELPIEFKDIDRFHVPHEYK